MLQKRIRRRSTVGLLCRWSRRALACPWTSGGRARLSSTGTSSCMMKRLPFALLLTIACRAEASSPPQPAALQHHDISASSMPRPFATQSAANPPRVVAPPANWKPAVPPGYQINLFASGFDDPRNMILAPNGDVLVADSSAGEVKIVRGNQVLPFARGLDYPYGLALRGNMLFIGESNAIARIAYPSRGKIERIATLPASGGHLTRNVIFNP